MAKTIAQEKKEPEGFSGSVLIRDRSVIVN
jgi:hypothetical protein